MGVDSECCGHSKFWHNHRKNVEKCMIITNCLQNNRGVIILPLVIPAKPLDNFSHRYVCNEGSQIFCQIVLLYMQLNNQFYV